MDLNVVLVTTLRAHDIARGLPVSPTEGLAVGRRTRGASHIVLRDDEARTLCGLSAEDLAYWNESLATCQRCNARWSPRSRAFVNLTIAQYQAATKL